MTAHQSETAIQLPCIAAADVKECGVCGSLNITAFCHECDQDFCQNCEKVHKSLPVTAHHNIVAIAMAVDTSETLTKCTEHPTNILHQICQDCEVVLCDDCAEYHLSHQGGHRIINVNDDKEILSKICRSERRNLIEYSHQLEKWQDKATKYTNECDDITGNWKVLRNEIVEVVNEAFAEAVSEAASPNTFRTLEQKLSSEAENVENQISKLSLLRQLRNRDDTNASVVYIAECYRLKQNIQTLQHEITLIERNRNKPPSKELSLLKRHIQHFFRNTMESAEVALCYEFAQCDLETDIKAGKEGRFCKTFYGGDSFLYYVDNEIFKIYYAEFAMKKYRISLHIRRMVHLVQSGYVILDSDNNIYLLNEKFNSVSMMSTVAEDGFDSIDIVHKNDIHFMKIDRKSSDPCVVRIADVCVESNIFMETDTTSSEINIGTPCNIFSNDKESTFIIMAPDPTIFQDDSQIYKTNVKTKDIVSMKIASFVKGGVCSMHVDGCNNILIGDQLGDIHLCSATGNMMYNHKILNLGNSVYGILVQNDAMCVSWFNNHRGRNIIQKYIDSPSCEDDTVSYVRVTTDEHATSDSLGELNNRSLSSSKTNAQYQNDIATRKDPYLAEGDLTTAHYEATRDNSSSSFPNLSTAAYKSPLPEASFQLEIPTSAEPLSTQTLPVLLTNESLNVVAESGTSKGTPSPQNKTNSPTEINLGAPITPKPITTVPFMYDDYDDFDVGTNDWCDEYDDFDVPDAYDHDDGDEWLDYGKCDSYDGDDYDY